MNIFGFALLAFNVFFVVASTCVAKSPQHALLEAVLGAVYVLWTLAAVNPRERK